MTNYATHLTTATQTERADPRQVKNSAGGYTFELDSLKALDRWLILGAEGGTYYASERELTLKNADTVRKAIAEHGPKVVERIVEISVSGRAPKNDPAIFALALAASCEDAATKTAALGAVRAVCRTGTHLFTFAAAVNSLRGWGRGLKRSIGAWYTEDRSPHEIVRQLTKYQQRNGWSHRDLLRLAHPKKPELDPIFRYVTKGELSESAPEYLHAFEQLKQADEKETIRLVEKHGFTHEMIATHHKNSAHVWEALLEKMPMTAMVRNLGKMTQVGLLKPLSSHSKKVSERLLDQQAITLSRIHPIALLSALRVYEQGHGERGSLTWSPDSSIVHALDKAFYLSFGNVEASGKNVLIGLDVSGSMASGSIAGVPGLTPRVASVAMALVTLKSEPNCYIMGFTGGFVPLPIHAGMSLNEAIGVVARLGFESTDCALPMLHATSKDIDVDSFQIWTDNETYCGSVHPHVALERYRQKKGRQATCAIVGCTATSFTIANPSDPGMLDVVGFDTATPNLLASFARGWQ